MLVAVRRGWSYQVCIITAPPTGGVKDRPSSVYIGSDAPQFSFCHYIIASSLVAPRLHNNSARSQPPPGLDLISLLFVMASPVRSGDHLNDCQSLRSTTACRGERKFFSMNGILWLIGMKLIRKSCCNKILVTFWNI